MKFLLAGLLLLGTQEFPRLSGPVTDLAGVLSPEQISQATRLSTGLQTSDSTQVVLLVIRTTNGRDIADYALQVGRQNGIGQKDKNNGALIVVAVDDRKCRIEVGTGLEGKLTDALCAQIIRNEMVPFFQKGDYGGGALRGMTAVVGVVKGEYKGAPPEKMTSKKAAIIIQLIMILVFAFIFSRRRGVGGGFFYIGGGGGGWGGGGGGGGGGWSGGGGSFGGGGSSGSW